MSEREAFESFCIGAQYSVERLPSGNYADLRAYFAWLGWQAALRYERERAREGGNAE